MMQHCAEERRKLAADWAHFHSLEKQRHERAEREAGSLLERREGSILSLAQVGSPHITGGGGGHFVWDTPSSSPSGCRTRPT